MQAFLIVDLQNDFFSKGALPVPNAEKIIPIINAMIPRFEIVIASQDWHPQGHVSFARKHDDPRIKEASTWPEHCVQGTWGACLVEALDQKNIKKIFIKGSLQHSDSYSIFFNDADKKISTGLNEFLKKYSITKIILVGLVLEYCIAATALDGLEFGYEVVIVEEGVSSLLSEQESQIFYDYLRSSGVQISKVNFLFNI